MYLSELEQLREQIATSLETAERNLNLFSATQQKSLADTVVTIIPATSKHLCDGYI